MEREKIVAALLKAAGGKLDSRTRVQRSAYLLDQLGLDSGFHYDYGHYGPSSRDLDNALADAKADGLVKEKFVRRRIDGVRYTIFELTPDGFGLPARSGQLNEAAIKRYMQMFAQTNVAVLELAASANWLAEQEGREDWQETLRRRKGRKAEGGRLDRALALLRNAKLPPATADANKAEGDRLDRALALLRNAKLPPATADANA